MNDAKLWSEGRTGKENAGEVGERRICAVYARVRGQIGVSIWDDETSEDGCEATGTMNETKEGSCRVRVTE